MSNEEPRKVKVTVKDKRIAARGGADAGSGSSPAASDPSVAGGSPMSYGEGQQAPERTDIAEPDYLAELQRERADFENYRKRMMREVASSSARAKAVIAEKLLPVLDNFERAIAHGEGGDGVALVFRELKSALESEGLVEIPAEGEVFDPNVHEAVMSADDRSVSEPTVTEVFRRGYRFGDQLLRAAMVVVARPADGDATSGTTEDAEE